MKDRFGRTIEYMRVSITDRCNLRCRYCMPEGCEKVPMGRILTYEEIVRICHSASRLGIRKIKITGGEPFVRLGCTDLIRRIKSIPDIDEVTVTTNGQTLYKYIDALKDLGIDGINISLDTMDQDRFRYITGGGSLKRTLQAIDLSAGYGIKTKINCLIQKGFNDDEICSLARLAEDRCIDVRFIEMMPIGAGDPARGISNKTILRKLKASYSLLEPDHSFHGNGPAAYYVSPDLTGSIGFISAIHGNFCPSCNRVRLTSQGVIKPCLCYEEGTDMKPYLNKTDEELDEILRQAIMDKPRAHCFTQEKNGSMEQKLMSQIGG